MVMPSVLSTAVYTTVSAVASFTVKVTIPLEFEVPLGDDMVECPEPAARVTALLETELPLESLSVTLMVDVVIPSAAMDVGLAPTVDLEALTPGGIPIRFVTDAIAPINNAIAKPFRVTFGCITDMCSVQATQSSPDSP